MPDEPIPDRPPITPLSLYLSQQVKHGGWHPDDDLRSLVKAGSGEPTFTEDQARAMERLTEAAFREAADHGLDLYDLVARALDLTNEGNDDA